MKLEDFDKVHALAKERRELLDQVAHVKSNNGLGVTIQGRYQEDDMLAVVRPHVLQFLQKRIDYIDLNLKDLGVS